MFSRWINKIFLLSAALMLAVPALAVAQTSRLEGMTLRPDYVKDPSGTFAYPSQLPLVGNYIYGELGNVLINPNTGSPVTLDRQVGAVLGNLWDGRLGTWGIYLREETPALGRGDAFDQPTPGVLGGDPNRHTHESFDVMWGQQFGTATVGLRLNRSHSKQTIEMPSITTTFEFDQSFANPNLSRNIIGLGGGVGFEVNPETNVELALLYQSRTFEASTSPLGVRNEEDQPTTYQFNARAMWEYQPNWMVVPVFKFYSYDLSTKTTTSTTTSSFDNTLKGWEAGVAGNWTLGSNDLFVLGVTFAQNKVEQQSDVFGIAGGAGFADTLDVTETHSPQVFAALETNVNPWLTLRMGATKGAFYNVKIEGRDLGTGEPTTVKFWDSPFEMNIGAGVKLGTLQLDAVLNTVFPQTLGWLGSGFSGVYFPKVTATYAF